MAYEFNRKSMDPYPVHYPCIVKNDSWHRIYGNLNKDIVVNDAMIYVNLTSTQYVIISQTNENTSNITSFKDIKHFKKNMLTYI